jgi:2-polyprenyl-6-methoxyphenol hydroxylase-like FAD-dependent oxidoreductase
MASRAIARQAVVIGAGIAGLAAARALSDHFEQVVVLERDSLSDGPVHRPGTPQSRHAHGLLVGGQRALSALFPGFERDLVEAGAVPVKASIDVRFERPGYDPFPQRDLGLVSYALSRPAIEFAVRKRLRSCANISLRDRCRVGDLLALPDGTAVTGVRFEAGGAAARTSRRPGRRCFRAWCANPCDAEDDGPSPPEETVIGSTKAMRLPFSHTE